MRMRQRLTREASTNTKASHRVTVRGFNTELTSQLCRLFVNVRIHAAVRSRFGQFFFEHFSNIGILVIVLDLIAAGFDVFIYLRDVTKPLPQAIFDASKPRREIASRCGAGIEVLMPHHCRRGKDAAVLPIIALDRFSFSPEERETFAFNDDDVKAGAVTVRFFIRTDRKL
jgi:hypothetical protein